MDEIQRKLALIDKELAGGRELHKQLTSTSPLLFAATGLIIGILIQNTFFGPPSVDGGSGLVWLWLMLPVFCAAGAFIFFLFRRDAPEPEITAYMALVCFLGLGAIRLSSFYQPEANDVRNFVADEQKLATIRGLIVTEPYINENRQWRFARFRYMDPASSFYLEADEVKTVDGWAKVSGRIRVQVNEPVLDLKAGDYVEMYCLLNKFNKATNPGQFDISRYLARNNVFIAASVKSRDGIKLLENRHRGIFTKIKRKVSKTAAEALLAGALPEDPDQGLLQALLLGYRRNIDDDTYKAFGKTGLLHFISLSGMHLGILVGIVWWLCKTTGLMKRARSIICIITIGVFLLIVPPRAPTLRAAIIGLVFCVSFLVRRHSNSLNTLSLAAIILLLIQPTQLFDAGWQLSFATVVGILAFTEKIENFLHERTNYWFLNIELGETNILRRLTKRAGKAVTSLFSVGFAAWLGGAGILLYHFYTITPLSSVWTVLVFPLVASILAFGYLKITIFFLLPTAASALGVVVTWLADLLIWIVECIANLGISQILIGHVPLTLVILYYCIISFAVFVHLRRPLPKKIICDVTILLLIVFLGVTKWQRTHRGGLVLTCLDVGHGQAILAQLPGKFNVLFDAGSLDRSDVGRRIVTPFLNYIGTGRIDAIIISHNDIDHINGIPEIAGHCKVKSVYANDAFFMAVEADPCETAGTLKRSLSKQGLEHLGEDLNLGSKAKIRILWPSEQICRDEKLSDNEKSVVSLIEFSGSTILLCSDIEKFGQRELLRLNPNLKADIVVVPHHGSAKTLAPDFLKKLDAKILMCSCSRNDQKSNRIIKPTSKVKWLCTAEHGAVAVCIEKDGMIR